MPDNCTSIYKTARNFAGFTQERAAEGLNISRRCLADYECGARIPHDEVVVAMVELYNFPQLAVQHLRASSVLARNVIPVLRESSLLEAAARFAHSITRLQQMDGAARLFEIGDDNAITPDERADYDEIAEAVQSLIQSAMELIHAGQGAGAGRMEGD